MESLKCVIATPAGRQRYIEILYQYLKHQKNDFLCWHLWLNTTDQNDINYMRRLESENYWIKCINPDWPYSGNSSIGNFFRYAIDSDTIYIRLDDDIVYLSPDFVRTLYTERLKYRDPLFIYPNIINNAVMSYLHFNNKLISYHNTPGYNCVDKTGWNDGKFAETVHNVFIDSLKTNTLEKWKSSFDTHTPINYTRVSINCVSWFGKDIANIYNEILGDEEQNISVEIPKKYNKPCLIVNYPICAHFAFCTQRPYLENNTNILSEYKKQAENI